MAVGRQTKVGQKVGFILQFGVPLLLQVHTEVPFLQSVALLQALAQVVVEILEEGYAHVRSLLLAELTDLALSSFEIEA